jgi:hypothetical protein
LLNIIDILEKGNNLILNFDKIAISNIIIIIVLFILSGYLLLRIRIKNKLYNELINKKTLIFILVIIALKILILLVINPKINDSYYQNLDQSSSYKYQGFLLSNNIHNSTIFEISKEIVNSHTSHGIIYGLFLGILYKISNSYSSLISIITTTIISTIFSIIIFLYLNSQIKKNQKIKNQKITLNYIITLLISLYPLFIINSVITSAEMFGTIFILITLIFFNSLTKSTENKSKTISNKTLSIIFLLSITSIIVNIKIEFFLFGIIIILNYVINLIIETINKKRGIQKKELMKNLLIIATFFFLNSHLIYNIMYDSSTTFFNLNIISKTILFIEHNFLSLFISFIIITTTSLILSFYKIKNKEINLTYLLGLFYFIFFLSFSRFKLPELRYTFIIFTLFILPLILDKKLNQKIRIMIVSIILLLQIIYSGSILIDFSQELRKDNIISENTKEILIQKYNISNSSKLYFCSNNYIKKELDIHNINYEKIIKTSYEEINNILTIINFNQTNKNNYIIYWDNCINYKNYFTNNSIKNCTEINNENINNNTNFNILIC